MLTRNLKFRVYKYFILSVLSIFVDCISLKIRWKYVYNVLTQVCEGFAKNCQV